MRILRSQPEEPCAVVLVVVQQPLGQLVELLLRAVDGVILVIHDAVLDGVSVVLGAKASVVVVKQERERLGQGKVKN